MIPELPFTLDEVIQFLGRALVAGSIAGLMAAIIRVGR